MVNEEYGLFFEGINKKGKKETYLIFKGRIDLIDMYTCFCKDASQLYDFFPSGDSKYYSPTVKKYNNTPNIQNYLQSNFINDFDKYNKNNDNYIGNHFYIKRVTGKGLREKFPLLYWQDRDIVYVNRDENKREIYEKLCELSLTVSECNKAQLKSLDTDDVKKARIKYNFFMDVFEEVRKRNPRLIAMFDDNAKEFTRNRIYNLATNKLNLMLLSKEIKKDPMLRRKLAIAIKETLKQLDDIDGVKTRMLSKEETNKRHNNREKYYFSLGKIYDEMQDLMPKFFSRPEHEDPDLWDEVVNNEYYDDSDEEPFLGPEEPGDKRYKRY